MSSCEGRVKSFHLSSGRSLTPSPRSTVERRPLEPTKTAPLPERIPGWGGGVDGGIRTTGTDAAATGRARATRAAWSAAGTAGTTGTAARGAATLFAEVAAAGEDGFQLPAPGTR